MTGRRKEPLASRIRRAKTTTSESEMLRLVQDNPNARSVLAAVARNPNVTAKVIDTLAALHLIAVGTDLIVSAHLTSARIEQLVADAAAWCDSRAALAHGAYRPHDDALILLAAALRNANVPDAQRREWAARAVDQLVPSGVLQAMVLMDNRKIPAALHRDVLTYMAAYQPFRGMIDWRARSPVFPTWVRDACQAVLNGIPEPPGR